MIDKGVCDRGYIWNPRNCECECDKSCDVGEYLDYKCLKKLANKLVEECTEIVEVKIASKHEHKGSFCILYIVLFSIFIAINIGIATYFIYYYWYLKKMFQALNLILILKQQFINRITNKY